MRRAIGVIVASLLASACASGAVNAEGVVTAQAAPAAAATSDGEARPDHRTKKEMENEALVRRWYATVLGPLNPDPAPEFLVPNFVQHSKLAKPGIEGFQEFVRAMQTQWTKPVLTVEAVYADGDYVIGRVRQQRWEGDEGLRIVNIYRIENGKMAEHWGTLQAPEVTTMPGK